MSTSIKQLETPVLFLAFNRPEKTALVFDSIRKVRPKKLYVAVDAPREGRTDDVENNQKVKEIVENVDWPCERHYLYQQKNLGCSRSGYEAWSWIFKHEESMIFVEDDGLGTPDAFRFVEEMLNKYKGNEKISYIGGVNYGPKFGDASYFFSRIPTATYFMGTWKRVFEKYEYDLESFHKMQKEPSFKESFISWQERVVFIQQFRSYVASVKKGRRQNTYDVQMNYLAFKNHTYSIYPNVNLVSNIGLDGGANNACSTESAFYKEYGNRPTQTLHEIKHPETISIDPKFEKEFFKKRALFNQHWAKSWFKAWFLNHFGAFYKKWIRPIRRRR